MADITPTPRKVHVNANAICNPYDLGGAASVGDAVYMATDGDVEAVDADASASAQGIGIIVAIGTFGALTGVAGDRVSVCEHGLVELAPSANLTAGGLVFSSTTAGKMDQTAPAASGDYPFALGRARSTTAIFVNPQGHAPVVNS